MNSTLKAALEYAARGWKVFPLQPDSKIPYAGTQGFKEATTDEAQLREWWEVAPRSNVGIATGAESGLVVLDVDAKSGGYASLMSGLPEEVAHTDSVDTAGGGKHFYYKHPGTTARNKAGFLPGLDIRGDGGYVVAPPSTVNGKPYLWGMEYADTVAPFPEALAKLVAEKPRDVANTTPRGESAVGEGGRNHYLTQVAGKLQRSDLLTLSGLMEVNERDCVPPLPDSEVETIFNSVSRYVPAEAPTDNAPEVPQSLVLHIGATSDGTLSVLSDKAKVKGLPTGVPGLDHMLGGGKRRGELTATCAFAKSGKNTFWHYLQYLWLEKGIPQGYASRELSPESEVNPNLLSIHFAENAWLSTHTPERVTKYRETMQRWQMYFAKGYGVFPLDDLKRWIDELQLLDVHYFWLDHLHYMLEDSEDFKVAAAYARELKKLTKTHYVHIDLIVQPTKIMEGQRLGLNSMRGGAAIGQAIDNLIVMERVKQEGLTNVSKITLDVARHKLCKPGHIHVQYGGDSGFAGVGPFGFVEVELQEESAGGNGADNNAYPSQKKWDSRQYSLQGKLT